MKTTNIPDNETWDMLWRKRSQNQKEKVKINLFNKMIFNLLNSLFSFEGKRIVEPGSFHMSVGGCQPGFSEDGINIVEEDIEVIGEIKERYQAKVVRELGEFFLWIMYRDSGYRDVFFWILDQILQRADEVRKYIKPYVKEPKDWNVNVWHDTKANTKKLRKEKRIPPYQKAFDENIFVPTEQLKKLKKIK